MSDASGSTLIKAEHDANMWRRPILLSRQSFPAFCGANICSNSSISPKILNHLGEPIKNKEKDV
jgi:hypothetical protein